VRAGDANAQRRAEATDKLLSLLLIFVSALLSLQARRSLEWLRARR